MWMRQEEGCPRVLFPLDEHPRCSAALLWSHLWKRERGMAQAMPDSKWQQEAFVPLGCLCLPLWRHDESSVVVTSLHPARQVS